MYQVRFACTQCGAIMKIRSKHRIKPGTAVKCVKCTSAVPVPITVAAGALSVDQTEPVTPQQAFAADTGSVRFQREPQVQRGPQGKRTRVPVGSTAAFEDEPVEDVDGDIDNVGELPGSGFPASEFYNRSKNYPLWRKILIPTVCVVASLLILALITDQLSDGQYHAARITLFLIVVLPFLLLMTAISLGIYVAPSIVAHSRKHRNFTPILILNLFFGWTVAFWILCLAWAFSSGTQNERIIVMRE